MSDQAINEMISAFAAGCMDKENYLHFYNYLKQNGELPYKELGKLQTLTSMLPSILELEQPAPELKKRVAQALIAIQDEIKVKIKIERDKTLAGAHKTEAPARTTKTGTATYIENTFNAGVSDVEAQNTPAPENSAPIMGNRLFTDNNKKFYEHQSFAPVWIAVVLLFIAVALIGYFGFKSLSDIKSSILKSEANLESVKSELRNTQEFISKNGPLIEFYNYDNIWTVPLQGADPALKISGRLLLALNDNEALLQINNLPTPPPENTYQLWVVNKNQTYSLGQFFIEPGHRFVRISGLPAIVRDQSTQFKITLEPRSGSILPTGATFASGPGGVEPAKKTGRR